MWFNSQIIGTKFNFQMRIWGERERRKPPEATLAASELGVQPRLWRQRPAPNRYWHAEAPSKLGIMVPVFQGRKLKLKELRKWGSHWSHLQILQFSLLLAHEEVVVLSALWGGCSCATCFSQWNVNRSAREAWRACVPCTMSRAPCTGEMLARMEPLSPGSFSDCGQHPSARPVLRDFCSGKQNRFQNLRFRLKMEESICKQT